MLDPGFKALCPSTRLWIIHGYIDNTAEGTTSNLIDEVISQSEYCDTRIEPILHARNAYKVCGKEPSRYRPSAEALRRRIKAGKGLYKISPAVDIINIVSIKSGISIGGYDFNAIEPPITLQIGGMEPYDAVGRGPLNIKALPSLYDRKGPFGSPTSDSARTMIKKGTRELLLVFYDFGDYDETTNYVKEAQSLLEKYCNLSAQYVGPV